jgi:hypothetical protein
MSYSDLSEAALENMSISERMEAIQKSLAVSLIPVLEALDSILKVIQKLMGFMGNWGGVIAMVAGGILFWKYRYGSRRNFILERNYGAC